MERNPPDFSSATRESPIIIEVGEAKVEYYIHKDVLIRHSEFFRKALTGPWKEAQERAVPLEYVECSSFDIFVHWIYTQKLTRTPIEWTKKCDENISEDDKKDSNYPWPTIESENRRIEMLMVETYALAEMLIAEEFRNAINNEFVDLLVRNGRVLQYSTIIYAFQNLPSNRKLLQFLVDWHCLEWGPGMDNFPAGEEARSQLPNEFLVRVMTKYHNLFSKAKKVIESAAMTKANSLKRRIELFQELDQLSGIEQCDYHEHANEEEKAKCIAGRK